MKSEKLIKRLATELWSIVQTMYQIGNQAKLGPYGQVRWDMPRTTYYRKLHSFERHGLVKRKKTSKGNLFIITAKAKRLRRKLPVKNSRNDGFSTLILFDIPQEKRNARDTLRRFLIRNGYTQIRESCFLSPFKISPDLIDLVKDLELEKNVSTFSAKAEYHVK